MSVFDSYQQATATFKKITKDGAGDETVSSSITVNIDPVFGYKKVFTNEGEVITGQSTVISQASSDLESFFDLTHRNWRLDYQGFSYHVEKPTPFYTDGTTDLEFIDVVLR